MRRLQVFGLISILITIIGSLGLCFRATLPFQAPVAQESEGVRMQIILVKTRPEAVQIIKRLQAGEPFAKLAREKSLDANAGSGGYMGQVSPSTLRPEVAAALKGLSPGQFTNPVETPAGYVILRVLTQGESLELESGATDMLAQEDRITPGVSGILEYTISFRHCRKPPGFYEDLAVTCETKRKLVEAGIQTLEKFSKERETQTEGKPALAAASGADLRSGETDVYQNQWEMSFEHSSTLDIEQWAAQMNAYVGNLEKALGHLQKEYQMAVAAGSKNLQLVLEEQIGQTYLQRALLERCPSHHDGRCFILPLSAENLPASAKDSEGAAKYFLQFLARSPGDLEVRWLLNLAYMTLGKYPGEVPKPYLIPPETFKSDEDIGRFVDVAPFLGLDNFQEAGGVIVDDFDNDGFLDIVTTDWGVCAPMHYYHNNGDGTFSDWTARSGLSNQLSGLSLFQADYNNDGCLDILVPRGAWLLPMRMSLLRNNCDGTFTDVTRQAGLAYPAFATQATAWLDYDNDGYLDLFVGNEQGPSRLYHNNGDGTFSDVTRRAGINVDAFTKAVSAGDYDNDGYPDLYIANMGTGHMLYHNNRDGTFTNVAPQLRVEEPFNCFPAFFFDYNNDGWLDIFSASSTFSMAAVARSLLKLPLPGSPVKSSFEKPTQHVTGSSMTGMGATSGNQSEPSRLYRNTGSGSFEDVTREVHLDKVFMPMGGNFGDIDNDGFLDIYLGTGAPPFACLAPRVLLRNHDGKYFSDITMSSGTGHIGRGHGIAFADIDNDGEVEIFGMMGGAEPSDAHSDVLFKRPGHSENSWVTVKLVGVRTNRAAIGARIKVTVENEDHSLRSIYRDVNSGGSFGASPLEQHIGLSRARRIDTIEIWWPTSITLLRRVKCYSPKPRSAIAATAGRSHQPGLDPAENLFPRRTRSFFWC